MNDNEYVQVVVTTDSRELAVGVAQEVVRGELAASGQVSGPITSIYRWKGEVRTAEEWNCVIQTRGDRYKDVEAVIRRMHPYEVPQIVVVPIVAGSPDYLGWLGKLGCD